MLDKVVPGYYQRLDADGKVTTDSCCADTAPEHAMMNRLVVDSVTLWAREYKVDGFRFDLMGLDPKSTMLDVQSALRRMTPDSDGVDGKNVFLYGEGWNFGAVADNARFEQATQANMAGTGIATFDDRIRDAARGGNFMLNSAPQQGFASGLYTDPNGSAANGTPEEQKARLLHGMDQLKVGLTGNLAGYSFTDSSGKSVTGAQVDYNGAPTGYAAKPGEAVEYVDAHDNTDLFDALAYKLPTGTAPADRARMQALALSLTALTQGAGFAQAGSDLLRSKSLDSNSYDSGDWFNAIHWDAADGNGWGRGLPMAKDNQEQWTAARSLLANPKLTVGAADIRAASAQYQEFLRIKRSSPLFSLPSLAAVQQRLSYPLSGTAGETPGVITLHLDGTGLPGAEKGITVVFNATPRRRRRPCRPCGAPARRCTPSRRAGRTGWCSGPASTPRPAPSPCRAAPWRCSSNTDSYTATTPGLRTTVQVVRSPAPVRGRQGSVPDAQWPETVDGTAGTVMCRVCLALAAALRGESGPECWSPTVGSDRTLSGA